MNPPVCQELNFLTAQALRGTFTQEGHDTSEINQKRLSLRKDAILKNFKNFEN